MDQEYCGTPLDTGMGVDTASPTETDWYLSERQVLISDDAVEEKFLIEQGIPNKTHGHDLAFIKNISLYVFT